MTPERQSGRETRLKRIDKGCSISVSLCLFIWTMSYSHVGLALQGCLCLFNYCNSGPPAECLHLALSEVREGKILKERKYDIQPSVR